MKFKDFLNESSITVYHGDDYNTKELKVDLMFNGNNQEGTGIYFANDISVAFTYGEDIVKATVQPKKFVDSRSTITKLNKTGVIKLIKDLYKADADAMFYLMTDYGIYLEEPTDIKSNHFIEFYESLLNEEIRDFQTTLIQSYNVNLFVQLWNKYIKKDGTFHKQTKDKTWYAI